MGEIPNPYQTTPKGVSEQQEKEMFVNILLGFLTLAPLKGYRTQVLGILTALAAVSQVLVGDTSWIDLLHQAPMILAGLGLTTLGAKVNTTGAKSAETGATKPVAPIVK